MYKPKMPFNVPARILHCTYTKINGVNTKNYTEGEQIFVSARSFGGTEKTTNDTYTILDTMEVDTWYRPDITSIDRIMLLDDNSIWEIISSPENIDRRNQYLRFKIERIKGDA